MASVRVGREVGAVGGNEGSLSCKADRNLELELQEFKEKMERINSIVSGIFEVIGVASVIAIVVVTCLTWPVSVSSFYLITVTVALIALSIAIVVIAIAGGISNYYRINEPTDEDLLAWRDNNLIAALGNEKGRNKIIHSITEIVRIIPQEKRCLNFLQGTLIVAARNTDVTEKILLGIVRIVDERYRLYLLQETLKEVTGKDYDRIKALVPIIKEELDRITKSKLDTPDPYTQGYWVF